MLGGGNTSRIQNKEVYATLCLQASSHQITHQITVIKMGELKWLASNIWIRDAFWLCLSDPSTFGARGGGVGGVPAKIASQSRFCKQRSVNHIACTMAVSRRCSKQVTWGQAAQSYAPFVLGPPMSLASEPTCFCFVCVF